MAVEQTEEHPPSAYFQVVETSADQPFHLRYVGGNHEPVLVQENLANREDAEHVVLMLAETFGLRDVELEDDIEGTKFVTYDGGFSIGAVVQYVDERTSP